MGRRSRSTEKTTEIAETLVEETDGNRRQKKILNHNFKLLAVKPLTKNQRQVFESYYSGQNLMIYGVAGSGKTFLALHFALADLCNGLTRQIIIVRSAVATRDQGFLPGALTEKMTIFENPYRDMMAELCLGRRDVYDILKKKEYLDFMSTSYMRGLTFEDAVIILDEAQNMTWHEIHSILTRVGKNCRIVICGDWRQNDLKLLGKRNQESGIESMIKVASNMRSFDVIEFGIADIVRSGFVREFIISVINLNLD